GILSLRIEALRKQNNDLENAIPPRTISPSQRETFLEALLGTNNVSPKISIKVVVGDTDPETEDFARAFMGLLAEAGYIPTNQEIIRVSGFEISQPDLKNEHRIPPVIALFTSLTGGRDIPPPTMAGFGSIAMMIPSVYSIAHGDTSHPRMSRYTENPNDILYGINSVLNFIGIPSGTMSNYGLLKPGEVGFFIPKQVP
ncbi:MAG: hypothetical protein ABSF34_12450, partial [Verrucomicrobiota bacterium]